MANFTKYLTVGNIVIVVLTIVALSWLISAFNNNRKVNNVRSWPTTNATIISALVQRANGNALVLFNPQNLTSSDANAKYIPRVLYRYHVAGKEYQSDKFTVGKQKAYDAVSVKTMMAPLTPGATVQAYYNPNNANEAYLYNGTTSHRSTWMGIILLLLLAGSIYYFKVMKKDRAIAGGTWSDYNIDTPNLSEFAKSAEKGAEKTVNDILTRLRKGAADLSRKAEDITSQITSKVKNN